ncbi:MAG: AGE family epimerase/isomerase [Alphaproteobacteria bacterium]
MADAVAATDERLRRLLEETILPFWYPILSAEDGAFALNHDAAGRWLGPRWVTLVAHARIIWTCARLTECGVRPEFFAAAGARAVRFLLDRMWDGRHGGFHWAVTPDGSRPLNADKHIYGQAFALLGLARHARVAGDHQARDAARRLFSVMDERAHDARHGGYREWFAEDWSEPPANRIGPIGHPAGIKTFNSHLHLMDAMRELVETTGDAVARSRLIELVLVNSCSVLRKAVGYATEPHRDDWRPLSASAETAGPYGHMAELAWMLPRAAAAAGLQPAIFDDVAGTLLSTLLRFGFDQYLGGVFDSGPIGAPVVRRVKNWWTQCEAMAAFLERWQLTGSDRWGEAYLKTLAWIEDRQVDRVNGEWHSTIGPDGTVKGFKADQWKCPYHHVRALLVCREMLRGATPATTAA